jgi:peptide/nickel transport system ATP-binding protein
MDNVILQVKDLHVSFKTYHGILKVLNGVNIEIHRGERVALVGESGGGKTTTLKAIMGILASNALIESGEIIVNGETTLSKGVKGFKYKLPRKTSMIFQDPAAALNPVFTIGQQIEYILKYSSDNTERYERKERALEALKLARLPDVERIYNSYPFQLSGGMRQRACIAMALAKKSDLLLADEPTTNLDVTIQDQVLRLIKNLSIEKGESLILVTHSLGVARMVCDKTFIMYGGEIVESGDTKTILEHPKHPYTKKLLECIPKLTAEGMGEGIPGGMVNYLSPPNGCRFYPRCENRMEICKENKPTMYKINDQQSVACHLYDSVYAKRCDSDEE